MRHVLAGRGWLFLLALALAAGAARADEREAAPDEARIKVLVAEAAAASPKLLDMLVRLGGRVTAQDVLGPDVDATLTVAALVLGGRPALDERDFRLLPGATPAQVLEALRPTEVRAGRRVLKHGLASLLHPEYVSQVSPGEVTGRAMRGRVQFSAPDAYEGAVEFVAQRAADGWRVVELSFPHGEVRTVLEEGRWRLRLPERARSLNPLRGAELTLARVGTVGTVGAGPDAPAPLVISVTREGWIRLPDRHGPVSLEEVASWLAHMSADATLRAMDGSSRLAALLDVDETIPWIVTQWILQACAHPEVRIHRIWLGAQTSDGAASGALFLPLPRDRGLTATPIDPGLVAPVVHRVKLFRLDGRGPASDPAAFFERLAQRRQAAGGSRPPTLEIVVPPPHGAGVPHGFVVQVLDACLATGPAHLTLECAAMGLAQDGTPLASDARRLKDYIDGLRGQPGVPKIKLDADPDFVPSAGAGIPARGALDTPHGGLTFDDAGALEDAPEDASAPAPPGPRGEAEEDERDAGGPGRAFRARGTPAEEPDELDRQMARAVDEGLRWLAAHQSADGSWAPAAFAEVCDGQPQSAEAPRATGAGLEVHTVGISALAVQAFLGAGYTHRGHHPYAKVVLRGLRFLRNVQDLEGCVGPRNSQQYAYSHALGALALVEAYGMTGSSLFKAPAQRALDFVALARNPYFAWRYGIKPGDNDTSVTGWMCLALHAARIINEDAVGRSQPAPLALDEAARDGARAWLAKVTDPDTGRVGYVTRGTGPARPQEMVQRFPGKHSEAATASSAFTRLCLGEDPARTTDLARGLGLLAALPPRWDRASGHIDMYYWHWGTLASWQVGGETWAAWKEALAKAALVSQRKDGDPCLEKGSWDPAGPWGPAGGRVYSTAMMLLCLEGAARYPRRPFPAR